MKLFNKRVENDNVSVTAAITTLSGNTTRLSEETLALSARVIEHQDHLDNLLGFEEARRVQMDDHWRSIVKIKATVEEVKTAATTQHARFTAQLDGLRANTEPRRSAPTSTTSVVASSRTYECRPQVSPLRCTKWRTKLLHSRHAPLRHRQHPTTLTRCPRTFRTFPTTYPTIPRLPRGTPVQTSRGSTTPPDVRTIAPTAFQPHRSTTMKGHRSWGGVSLRLALPKRNDRPGRSTSADTTWLTSPVRNTMAD
jgi:hypothetical protein